MSTASASSENGMTATTGPKISSRTTRMSWWTPVSTVGSYKKSRARCADLAGIAEDRSRRPGDGSVEVGIPEDDDRGLPTQLEGHLLEVSSGGLNDLATHLGRASEGDL